MGKNISTNINNNLSCKYSQTFFVHAKKICRRYVNKREIQKTAEAISDLIGNKIADKIKKVSKNSEQNNSEKGTTKIVKQRNNVVT